ncbi:probable tRNA (guanine(26)-N(2))-dimethyltransferase [Belonocnema kinseyi]|uniref:probable tRNA (guanine(26)-N(2))-dimethyltransferase n=1 Tax=Belonocnema kinseyi TaxID=2817044 RepID=UPI00143D6D06|nr:probable tRNA (guanine(26)-N(2))-dimethyltransferase [Belonocnema kinseyi]XP_033219511.1 probable tRNA (guanine(26)-N(2))-dimethyltransferase [Belonocnema kinseyi]
MENKDVVMESEEKNTNILKEGKAEILVQEKNVFYNPVQEFNRDLSIAVLSLFAEDKNGVVNTKNIVIKETIKEDKEPSELKTQDGIRVLEALSATGLRSIRYAKEVKGIKCIVANDIATRAIEAIKKNIAHNGVENIVIPSHEDATMVMYQNRKTRFDAIDLDPYGCPSIFLDGAVQSVSEGGLLLVTATDMAVLAGNSPETCYVKYGAVSLKSKACHEIALRILLQHISAHAGRYGRYIQPLLSVSADFYIRVFVRVFTGQKKCKENTTRLGMLYQCHGCESMTIQPLGIKSPSGGFKLPGVPIVDQHCKYCQHKHHVGGPLWLDPLHDQNFVSRLLCKVEEMELGTLKRIQGVLNVVREELDCPLYYTLDRLMSIVRCDTPSMVLFRSAVLNAGYRVSYSHANKISIKTDAPNDVIWDIVRAWEKEHPAKRDRLDKKSPALAILTKESVTQVSFTLHPDANPVSRQKRLSRFPLNPESNWGPGTKSCTMINREKAHLKRKRNQNKNEQNKKKAEEEDITENVVSESKESVEESKLEA